MSRCRGRDPWCWTRTPGQLARSTAYHSFCHSIVFNLEGLVTVSVRTPQRHGQTVEVVVVTVTSDDVMFLHLAV